MTVYQFNTMDEMEQIEAIWYHSTRLAEREDEPFLYILYQIDGFYVEEKVHKEHNVRHAFKTFSSTNSDLLKPYLNKIDISNLPA